MTEDQRHKELMVVLVGIKEILEEGFKAVNLQLNGIGLDAGQSKNLIESLRSYTVGKIERGG